MKMIFLRICDVIIYIAIITNIIKIIINFVSSYIVNIIIDILLVLQFREQKSSNLADISSLRLKIFMRSNLYHGNHFNSAVNRKLAVHRARVYACEVAFVAKSKSD